MKKKMAINSERSRKYWSNLKDKFKKEGSELSEKIGQFKMLSEDSKMRLMNITISFPKQYIIA